jgi:hypothetical protein
LKLQVFLEAKTYSEDLKIMEELFQKNIPINIEDEMKKSYMAYAMSVIIGIFWGHNTIIA